MNRKKVVGITASISIVLLLILVPVIGACGGAPGEQQTLKIGGCMPLSGPPSAAGLAWKLGWELGFDTVNEDGGIKIGDNTYMFEILVEDSKASAEGGTTAATKLVYQDGVKFVMGDIADFMVPSIYEVTLEGGALFGTSLLAVAADVPGSFADVSLNKPLLIRLTPASSETDILPMQYIAENYPDAKRVGLMALGFPEYDQFPTYYGNTWAPMGFTLTDDYERFPPDFIDFSPAVTRLLETNPDIIYISRAALSQYPLIVKAARDQGFNGPIVFPLPAEPDFAAEAVPNGSDIITVGMPLDSPDLPEAVKAVVELGRAKYGRQDFVSDCVFAYDQAVLLTQMIEKAQSVDPQVVMDTFETLTTPGDLKSVFGDAYVGGLQTTGVNRVLVRPNPMSILVNGKGVYLGMFTVDVP
jgi:branched-chain amino acid transport system substrate-binding protein